MDHDDQDTHSGIKPVQLTKPNTEKNIISQSAEGENSQEFSAYLLTGESYNDDDIEGILDEKSTDTRTSLLMVAGANFILLDKLMTFWIYLTDSINLRLRPFFLI